MCVCFHPSGACCPLGVKLYRLSPDGVRISWQAARGSASYSAELYGSKGIFTCSPSTGLSFCDVTEIPCGDVYTVMVLPVAETGLKLTFCPKKIYSGTASCDPLSKTNPSLNLWIKTQSTHTSLREGRSKRVWGFYILRADSGYWGPPASLESLCFVTTWFGDTLPSLSLSPPSGKGPEACCLNSKANLKWFPALRFGGRFFFKDFVYFCLESGEGGRKRRRKTSICERYLGQLPLKRPQWIPGMCPDWELNKWPFSWQASTQSTEPHQPGLGLNF